MKTSTNVYCVMLYKHITPTTLMKSDDLLFLPVHDCKIHGYQPELLNLSRAPLTFT